MVKDRLSAFPSQFKSVNRKTNAAQEQLSLCLCLSLSLPPSLSLSLSLSPSLSPPLSLFFNKAPWIHGGARRWTGAEIMTSGSCLPLGLLCSVAFDLIHTGKKKKKNVYPLTTTLFPKNGFKRGKKTKAKRLAFKWIFRSVHCNLDIWRTFSVLRQEGFWNPVSASGPSSKGLNVK